MPGSPRWLGRTLLWGGLAMLPGIVMIAAIVLPVVYAQRSALAALPSDEVREDLPTLPEGVIPVLSRRGYPSLDVLPDGRFEVNGIGVGEPRPDGSWSADALRHGRHERVWAADGSLDVLPTGSLTPVEVRALALRLRRDLGRAPDLRVEPSEDTTLQELVDLIARISGYHPDDPTLFLSVGDWPDEG